VQVCSAGMQRGWASVGVRGRACASHSALFNVQQGGRRVQEVHEPMFFTLLHA
jgi:hypothetical protein